MCNSHSKVFGVRSVKELAKADLEIGGTCLSRYLYLERHVRFFQAWLNKQEWCEDPVRFCEEIAERVKRELDPDTDKWCSYIFEEKEVDRTSIFEYEAEEYHKSLEIALSKGFKRAFSKEEKLRELEVRLEKYVLELKLHDKIQDSLEKLPEYQTPGQFLALFKRIDALKKKGDLSYSGWIAFNNQLMKLIGREEYKPRFETKELADQITDLERQIKGINEEIVEEEASNFLFDPHPDADVWIDIQTRLGR